MVVNTDALTGQNRFLFHFIYLSQSNCGGWRGEEGTEEKGYVEDEGKCGEEGCMAVVKGTKKMENRNGEKQERIAHEWRNKRAKMRGAERR